MSTTAADALGRATRRLRDAPEPGWTRISDSVIAKVRATSRRTTPVAASLSDLPRTEAPVREGESTHVSDHVIATHLNRAITAAHPCALADVVLSLDGDMFLAASVHVVGEYGADLHVLGEQVRVTAIGVLTDLLGPHHPPLTLEQVDVRVSDITAGDPRRT